MCVQYVAHTGLLAKYGAAMDIRIQKSNGDIMVYIDKSFLGRRPYRQITTTCCICKRPVIRISKIKIKPGKYIYHCEGCKKLAEEKAAVLIEDYKDGIL